MFFRQKEDKDRDEQMSTDYKDRCGNCTNYLGKENRYCRYCGTKRGKGAFKPYMISSFCIYGPPPVKRRHICRHCGNSWTTEMMIDDQKYCGQCGKPAEISTEMPSYRLFCKDTDEVHSISAFDRNVTVGRGPDLEIQLRDPSVNRLHAQFIIEEDKLCLVDMGSTNGTYVNRQRIGTAPHPLKAGDEIRFGKVTCILEER